MNMCPHCHIEFSYRDNSYCRFCYLRLARLRWAFRRGGKTMRVCQLHRTWKHWRQTAELDALYAYAESEAA